VDEVNDNDVVRVGGCGGGCGRGEGVWGSEVGSEIVEGDREKRSDRCRRSWGRGGGWFCRQRR